MTTRRLLTLISPLLAVWLAIPPSTSAQFLSGSALPGHDDPMHALAVFDDGTGAALYATGDVFRGDGAFLNSLGKWDGVTWQPVGGGLGDPTADHLWYGRALVVHDDGDGEALCVGGLFFEVGGEPAGHVACWDGTTWDTLGGGLLFRVDHLASFDDGGGPALYATGTEDAVMRWDGTAWQAVPGSEGAIGLGGAMLPFDGGTGERLYAAGNFDVAGGGTQGIGSWDGSQWNPVQGPIGPDGVQLGYILDMAVYDDGSGDKLYVGGVFSGAGGVSSPNLAAWTGSQWLAVPSPPVVDEISALTVYDDGSGPRLVAAINVANDDSLVVAWDGQTWSELATPGRLAEGTIADLAVFDEPTAAKGIGSRLFAAGAFKRSGDLNKVAHVGRWDGQAWTHVGRADWLGLDHGGDVVAGEAFAAYDDGGGTSLYLGGQFSTAGGAYARAVARYDGTSFAALRDPSGEGLVSPEVDDLPIVWALQVFDDGQGPRLFVAGDFSSGGSHPMRHFAAWDGVAWDPVVTSLIQEEVYALAVFDDGNGEALYLGGRFDVVDGTTVHHIAKWDGVAFSPLLDQDGTPGVGSTVRDLEVYDDGSGPALYAVGSFTTAGSDPADGLARWHPNDGWTSVGGFTPEANRSPVELEVFDDGAGPALYIGGYPGTVNGMTTNGIVKWDGATFSALAGTSGIGLRMNDGSPGAALTLEAFDAGAGQRLYVGGTFDTAGGVPAADIASWDGQQWRRLIGSGRVIHDVPRTTGSTWVSALLGFDDGVPTLFIAGRFSEIGGHTSYYFSRYVERESVFSDGFESGNPNAWSNASGVP